MRKKLIVLLAFPASVLWVGCSSPPSTPAPTHAKSEAKPAEKPKAATQFATGRTAFQRLYTTAKNWAMDVQPIRLESRPRKEDKPNGEASVWSANFASPSKQQIRSFLWSGSSGEGAPEPGVTPGGIDVYSPGNVSTRPFDLAYLKVDTDKALQVANKNGGAKLLKKTPDLPIKFILYWDYPKSRLLWRVVYGGNENNSNFIVDVNASSAEFVKIEK